MVGRLAVSNVDIVTPTLATTFKKKLLIGRIGQYKSLFHGNDTYVPSLRYFAGLIHDKCMIHSNTVHTKTINIVQVNTERRLKRLDTTDSKCTSRRYGKRTGNNTTTGVVNSTIALFHEYTYRITAHGSAYLHRAIPDFDKNKLSRVITISLFANLITSLIRSWTCDR